VRDPLNDTRAFYDDLAEDYDLIFADWEASVRRQGELIDGWLGARQKDPAPLRILDVACGMGTQAIGLALRGHRVVGRDLSPRLVERAREAALRFGVELDLGVADMRDLDRGGDLDPVDDRDPVDEFDAVLALDNALPHLEADEDLERTLRAARQALRPGGTFLASIRDYDRLRVERPTLDPPRVLGGPDDRRIVLQAWEWDDDGKGYSLDLLILRRSAEGAWTLRSRTGRYRALLRAELDAAARRAGLSAARWIEPVESGFYQPVFEARRSA
jgi:SAM-dependent methyltransferase